MQLSVLNIVLKYGAATFSLYFYFFENLVYKQKKIHANRATHALVP